MEILNPEARVVSLAETIYERCGTTVFGHSSTIISLLVIQDMMIIHASL